MANVVSKPDVKSTAILRLDTAADDIVVGPIRIQTIIFTPSAAADTCQIEDSSENIRLVITSPEEGTAANAPITPVVIPFPNGLKMNGLSLGSISSGAKLDIILSD